jgi:hypothetical protein
VTQTLGQIARGYPAAFPAAMADYERASRDLRRRLLDDPTAKVLCESAARRLIQAERIMGLRSAS